MPDGSVKMLWNVGNELSLGEKVLEEKMKKAEKDNPAEETKKEPGQSIITAQPKGDNPPSKNEGS